MSSATNWYHSFYAQFLHRNAVQLVSLLHLVNLYALVSNFTKPMKIQKLSAMFLCFTPPFVIYSH